MQFDLTPASCVKMYTADLKNWMRVNVKKMRLLPLAYAAADGAFVQGSTKTQLLTSDKYTAIKIQGLLCGDKMENGLMRQSIDIYLLNEYRWCRPTDWPAYQQIMEMARGVPIVIALGEMGCTVSPPRTWDMVPYLFGDKATSKGFTDAFSGGIAYTFGDPKTVTDKTFSLFTGTILTCFHTYSVHASIYALKTTG